MNLFVEWFMSGGRVLPRRKLPAGGKGLPSVDDVNRIVDRISVHKNSPSVVVVTQRDWSPEGLSAELSYVQLTIRGPKTVFTLEPGEVAELTAAEQFDILDGAFLPNVYAYPTAILSNRLIHVELTFRSMGTYWLLFKNNGKLPITFHGGDPVAWLMFGNNPIEVSYK